MTNSPNDFINEILGKRYQVEKLLGKKAGRKTVLARDTLNNQLVVVKVLIFGNDFTWEDLKLFEREAQTLQSIHHPLIPKYLDFFDFAVGKGKGYALVQSYVQGKSLEEYIQAGYIFTAGEIKSIATKLLAILEYLHQQKPPVIHRDIKPSNIIYIPQKTSRSNQKRNNRKVFSYPDKSLSFGEYLKTRDEEYLETKDKPLVGEIQSIITKLLPKKSLDLNVNHEIENDDLFSVYLVDFGSVQTVASKAGNTMTVVGTYGYMPPEQFGGRAYPASDLYSLGATLIACATGIHPADLPHNDMQIDFARQTKLSENFTNWLSWLTNPTLEHRPPDAKSAIAILNQQLLNSHSYVGKLELLSQSLYRNVLTGLFIAGLVGFLYGAFVSPLLSIPGSVIGFSIGSLTGIFNGLCVWAITIYRFYPLRHPLVYKQVIQYSSFFVGCIGYLVCGSAISLVSFQGKGVDISLFTLLPAIFWGLTLGEINKSLALWYEQESNSRLSRKKWWWM